MFALKYLGGYLKINLWLLLHIDASTEEKYNKIYSKYRVNIPEGELNSAQIYDIVTCRHLLSK